MEIDQIAETAKTDIEMKLHKIRSKLPQKVLQMKISEVRTVEVLNSVDSPVINSESALASFNSFQTASPVPKNFHLKKSTSDEGYGTHEETKRISRSSRNQVITGPFISSQIKKRRSRSAQSSSGGLFTPQVHQLAVPLGSRSVLKRTHSNLLSNRPSR